MSKFSASGGGGIPFPLSSPVGKTLRIALGVESVTTDISPAASSQRMFVYVTTDALIKGFYVT